MLQLHSHNCSCASRGIARLDRRLLCSSTCARRVVHAIGRCDVCLAHKHVERLMQSDAVAIGLHTRGNALLIGSYVWWFMLCSSCCFFFLKNIVRTQQTANQWEMLIPVLGVLVLGVPDSTLAC